MDIVRKISSIKKATFRDALIEKFEVRGSNGEKLGHLVPVGPWLLFDNGYIEKIAEWRRKFNKMFPSRSNVDAVSTINFLREFYVDNTNAILFLIFTNENSCIGHIGLSNLDSDLFEITNLIRGSSGGDSDLIFQSELSLLKFGFQGATYSGCFVEVMSYNWIVTDLHQRAGFRKISAQHLRKISEDTSVFHQRVDKNQRNVEYTIDTLSVSREDFLSSFY